MRLRSSLRALLWTNIFLHQVAKRLVCLEDVTLRTSTQTQTWLYFHTKPDDVFIRPFKQNEIPDI